MNEAAAGHYHSDSIITTIYEGTSEIQASFALKEMGKGALFAALDATRAKLEELRPRYPEAVAEVCDKQTGIGIDFINEGELTKGGHWTQYLAARLGG